MKKIIAFFASLLSVGAVSAGTAPDETFTPRMTKAADLVAWEEAKQHASNRALVNFLLLHPDSQFVEDAQNMLIDGAPHRDAVVNVQPEGNASDLYSDMHQHI